MSGENYPTLYQVLPFFNYLSFKLDQYLGCQFGEEPDYIILESKGKPKEIAIALDAARSKLRKYYDKTENSPLYCIATGI